MIPARQAENQCRRSAAPQRGQQQKEQHSTDIAIELKRAQQLFQLSERPADQTGRMSRVHRIASQQIQQDGCSQKRRGRTQNF